MFLEQFCRPPAKIACRLLTSAPLETATKNKISMFCHVQPEQVVGIHNVSSVYHVPLMLRSQGLIEFLHKRLDLQSINIPPSMVTRGEGIIERWKELTKRSVRLPTLKIHSPQYNTCRQERVLDDVSVVLVGKYTDMKDSYMSVVKALEHSAFRCSRKLILQVTAFPRLCMIRY